MAFWVTYDHAGKLLLANLVASIAVAVPAMLGVAAFMTHDMVLIVAVAAPMLALAWCVAMPVAAAGLAHMVKELIDTRDGAVRTMFDGMRLYWRRAIALGTIYGAAVLTLTTSVWFYATKLRDTAPWLGYAVSTVALWCLAFVALTALLLMPALVQKRAGIPATLKLTALLVLDNLLFVIGLALTILALGATVLVPPVFFFCYAGLAIVIVSCAYELLARKYEAVLSGPQPGAKATHIGPVSAARDGTRPLAQDERDDYLNRGFRDFLFPWKE